MRNTSARPIPESGPSRSVTLLILIALILCVTACSKRYSNLPAFSSLPIYDSKNNSVGRFKTSYLADQLDSYFRGSISGRIVITTFVDINNLYGSSAFGRVLSEQLMSELAMKGYHVVEMRQSEVMQIMLGQGEFGLSQEMRVLRKSHDISGIIVGTYTISPERVYINARLLDPANSEIKSAGSVEMPVTEEIDRLLRTNIGPPVLERIPVKALGSAPQRRSWQAYAQETGEHNLTLGEITERRTDKSSEKADKEAQK